MDGGRAEPEPDGTFDAVVLAGGSARRLGRDKPAVVVGGQTLLDRVLGAAAEAGASRLVVVGPPRASRHRHRAVREHPPGGGPVAGLMAGLTHVAAELVAVLAADLPFLTVDAVRQLRSPLMLRPSPDGVVAIDEAGRRQWLLGVWQVDALRSATKTLTDPTGVPMRELLGALSVATVKLEVPSGAPPPWFDCDTAQGLGQAQEMTGRQEEVVGLTQDVGFQIGVQRTLPVPAEELWDFLTSPDGLAIWLGPGVELAPEKGAAYRTDDGTVGDVRSFRPMARVRLTWRPAGSDHESTVQVAVTGKGDRSAVRFHQERMTSAEEREVMRTHWQAVVTRLAAELAAAPRS